MLVAYGRVTVLIEKKASKHIIIYLQCVAHLCCCVNAVWNLFQPKFEEGESSD